MEVVITRRLFSFILAGVITASSIFPAFAWNQDSFISGAYDYEPLSDFVPSYDLPASDVNSAPSRFRIQKVSAADQAAVESNITGKLVVPATLPTSVDGMFQVMSKSYRYRPSQSTPPLPKFEYDYWDTVVASFSPSPFLDSVGYVHVFPDQACSYTPDVSDKNDMIRGLAVFCDKDKAIIPKGNYITGATADPGSDSWSFITNYDVSSFSSSAFSLDGLDTWALFGRGPYWGDWNRVSASSVDVFVDGQQVLTLSRGNSDLIDFGGYVFSGAHNVSTISFRWHLPFFTFLSDDPNYAGTYRFSLRSDVKNVDSMALTISFLDGQDVIIAQNDKTKSDINKHEELESQWFGSMTENFNALGFDTFSWTDDLVSGFSLFSGIFMDIWRSLGSATILFSFPLLLGVALLLIGRISRSGGRSGSGKGGGDSG